MWCNRPVSTLTLPLLEYLGFVLPFLGGPGASVGDLLEVHPLTQCRLTGRHNPAYVFSAKGHLLAAAARLAHGRGQPRASACTIRGAGECRRGTPAPLDDPRIASFD